MYEYGVFELLIKFILFKFVRYRTSFRDITVLIYNKFAYLSPQIILTFSTQKAPTFFGFFGFFGFLGFCGFFGFLGFFVFCFFLGQISGWLVGWLAGLAGWLAWLADWLAGWPDWLVLQRERESQGERGRPASQPANQPGSQPARPASQPTSQPEI